MPTIPALSASQLFFCQIDNYPEAVFRIDRFDVAGAQLSYLDGRDYGFVGWERVRLLSNPAPQSLPYGIPTIE